MGAYRNTGNRSVGAGSTLTMSEVIHEGKTVNLDTAAGCTVTLPASRGLGAVYRFLITTKATSNSHIIKVANSSDSMIGFVITQSDDSGNPSKQYFAATNDDTITLNRGTTGSVSNGEWIEIVDAAANTFAVRGFTSSTGTEATPFSSTV